MTHLAGIVEAVENDRAFRVATCRGPTLAEFGIVVAARYLDSRRLVVKSRWVAPHVRHLQPPPQSREGPASAVPAAGVVAAEVACA